MVYIILGCFIFLFFLQSILFWKYQRQIKDICRQLAFQENHDSNMMITGEISYGGIGKLMDLLNELLQQKKREKAEYQKKEKIISDTYTNLSHDIRTPLTSLDGYFQLLESSDNQEEQRRYIQIIQGRIDSLKDMLEELFTFTKLKNDSYSLELSCCCMNRILKKTIFSYYEDWTKQGIEPVVEITDEMLYLMGNEQSLERVIQNIIKNAMDHGEKNIKVSLQKEQKQIVLAIRNQVANPDKIDVSQVFERFYKEDKARSRNSTGLGLSIAREFVIRMNGQIEAMIVNGQFCICVKFPVIEPKERERG